MLTITKIIAIVLILSIGRYLYSMLGEEMLWSKIIMGYIIGGLTMGLGVFLLNIEVIYIGLGAFFIGLAILIIFGLLGYGKVFN